MLERAAPNPTPDATSRLAPLMYTLMTRLPYCRPMQSYHTTPGAAGDLCTGEFVLGPHERRCVPIRTTSHADTADTATHVAPEGDTYASVASAAPAAAAAAAAALAPAAAASSSAAAAAAAVALELAATSNSRRRTTACDELCVLRLRRPAVQKLPRYRQCR